METLYTCMHALVRGWLCLTVVATFTQTFSPLEYTVACMDYFPEKLLSIWAKLITKMIAFKWSLKWYSIELKCLISYYTGSVKLTNPFPLYYKGFCKAILPA